MAAGSQNTGGKGQGSGNGTRKRATGQKNGAVGKRTAAGKASAGNNTAGKRTNRRTEKEREIEELQEESIWHRYQDEIILMVTLVLSVLLLLSNFHLCGPAGDFINRMAFGLLGFLAYLFPVLLFFGTAFYLSNRKNRSVVHKLMCMVVLFFILAALLQLITYGSSADLKAAELYRMSADGRDGGGILGGGLSKLLCSVIDVVGTYIVLIGVMIVLLMFITEKFLFSFLKRKYQERRAIQKRRREQQELEEEQETWLEETALAREEQLEETAEEFGKVYSLEEQKKKRRKVKSYTFPTEEEKRTDSVEMRELKLQNLVIQRGGETEVIDVSPYYEEELKKKFGGQEDGSVPEEVSFLQEQESLHEKSEAKRPAAGNDKILTADLLSRNSRKAEEESMKISSSEGTAPFNRNPYKGKVTEESGQSSSLEQPETVELSDSEKTVSPGEGLLSWDMLDKNLDILEPVSEKKRETEETEKTELEYMIGHVPENASENGSETASGNVPEARPEKIPFFASQSFEEEKERILKAKSIQGSKPLDSYAKTPPVEQASVRAFAPSIPMEKLLDLSSETFSDASDFPTGSLLETGTSEQETSKQKTLEQEIQKPEALDDSAPSVSAPSDPAQTARPKPVAEPATEPASVAESSNLSIPAIQPSPEPYRFPSLDLLNEPPKDQRGASNEELQETAMTLQKTLDSFGVRVTVTNVSCGPAVTRYELQPERGVKVSRITGLTDDIKLNLAAADIRIEAPIPGKAAVGIEVPNKENATVFLRELLETEEFQGHKSSVAFAVGKDIGGQTVVTDIAKMPHLLIAGATGSGKSVCINTLIMSVLYKADPNDVKLIMIDPKVVELSVYNGIPHLLIPVVTDPKKASGALNWAVMEMMDRYQRFADVGVREVKGYNEKIASVSQYKEDPRYVKMPQIVIIVDELADLMMVAPGEVEDAICRLAQLARAAGIHLVIATQRPSVNVITGLIKANIPSRIAFAVSSAIDSRTILDGAGAEKLLGKGDMLFFPTGYPKPVRVQGAFVSDQEVTAVVDYLREQNGGTGYNAEVIKRVDNAQPSPGATGGDAAYGNGNGQDEYFAEAGKFIIEKDKASIGMLQRVYKIGFNRAARIMDQLSDAGVVGPEEGTKPRKVLMSLEEFENYLEQN